MALNGEKIGEKIQKRIKDLVESYISSIELKNRVENLSFENLKLKEEVS